MHRHEEAIDMHDSASADRQATDKQNDTGFTLIEILIAIVLVGILSAVAVVGISNLVGKGSKSSCGASADAAKAASHVYFATNATFPTSFTQLTAAGVGGAPYVLPALFSYLKNE